MDALLFVIIMVAALGVAALVIGRAQRTPSPDDPSRPEPGINVRAADDPRDRPAGPGAERDAPHSSQLRPGEVGDAAPGADDVARPPGGVGDGQADPGG